MQKNWALRGNNANADFCIEELIGTGFSDTNVKITVQSGGNVGIGTTAPDSPLEIYRSQARTSMTGTAFGTLHIDGGEASSYISSITLAQYANVPISIIGTKTDTSFGTTMFFGTSNSYVHGVTNTAMVIRYDGNVGIGTTSPSTKLHVDGVITATGGTSTNWNTAYGWGNHATANYWSTSSPDPQIIAAGSVTFQYDVEVQGTFSETSARRYKENIVDLEPVTDKVYALRPVRYNKIGTETQEIGLIAEEVAELFPEVVHYNDEGQPESLNYTRLSVLLLQTVKELSERIQKLENK